jgi:hypothetical protein
MGFRESLVIALVGFRLASIWIADRVPEKGPAAIVVSAGVPA